MLLYPFGFELRKPLFYFALEPGTPQPPQVQNIAQQIIQVTWTNPSPLNGPLTKMSAIARKADLSSIADRADSRYCNRVNHVDTSCNITSLKFYTNYSVTVLGYNEPLDTIGGGYGSESSSVQILTVSGRMRFVFSIIYDSVGLLDYF